MDKHDKSITIGTGDMAKDWDERAREDYRYYIDTGNNATDAEFDASGKHDVAAIVQPIYDRIKHGSILEIGCGAGRMTQHLVKMFELVIGMDCSGEMLKRALERMPKNSAPDDPESNAVFYWTNGIKIRIKPDYVDYALCYAVLDHIPRRDYIVTLLTEIYRVLKPGGMATLEIGGCGLEEGESVDTAGTWRGVLWTVESFSKVLGEIGFTIKEMVDKPDYISTVKLFHVRKPGRILLKGGLSNESFRIE